MPKTFYSRLEHYYRKVGEVLRGDADAASVFPNTTDIGIGRERVYAEFLRQHAPSKCNVFLGGFLFHLNGTESKQLDVIITTDTAPQFNFHNHDGGGKSFSPVEGTLAVSSIKSTLNKAGLIDSLEGLASIPETEPLEGRESWIIKIHDYDDWPYKVIFANQGISPSTIMDHLQAYYSEHPEIPLGRRPNIIHVAGQYVIFRAVKGLLMHDRSTGISRELESGSFHLVTQNPDVSAIVWVLDKLQQRATASSHILFRYGEIINRISRLDSLNQT